MFGFDNGVLGNQLASFAAERAESLVEDMIARVNQRAEHHEAGSSRDGKGRARTYDTTPGSTSQSLAPFVRGVRDILIDDARAARRAPDDVTARFRLMLSAALYAAIGDRFAGIVVSADVAPAGDPLARPALPPKSSKVATLRADHLSMSQQEAVLDAASNDPARVAKARAALGEMIRSGNDAEVQIAAALSGTIVNPLDRHKLNALAEKIDKARWQAGAPPAAAATVTATPIPMVSATAGRPVPAGRAQVVTSGGKDARRITPDQTASTPDDLAAFYGEEG